MKYLDRAGVKIAWDVAGDGPAVLLNHGMTSTSRMWDSNVKALAATHTVITWDFRGHGESDYPLAPEAYSPAIFLEDMAALLDTVGVAQAVVGGMSLGGYLSLEFLLAYPERTAGLILVDTGPGFKKPAGRQQWNDSVLARADRMEGEGLAVLDQSRPEVALARHRDASGLILVSRNVLTQRDDRVIKALPDVSVPTLIVVGERDEPFVGACRYMASKIGGSRLHILADAGHAANIDQAQAFNDLVAAFLEDKGL